MLLMMSATFVLELQLSMKMIYQQTMTAGRHEIFIHAAKTKIKLADTKAPLLYKGALHY